MLDVSDQTIFPNGVYFIVAESPIQGYLSQKVVIAR